MPSAPLATFPSRSTRVLTGLVTLVMLISCSPDDDPSGLQSDGSSGTAPRSGSSSPSNPGSASDAGDVDGAGIPSSVRIGAEDRKRTVRGSAPAYVQIASASVDAAVDRLRMAIELTGKVPRKMPNPNSVLRATFMLTAKDGVKYIFEAQCLRTGWGAFASGGSTPDYIPVLSLSERGLTLTIDPVYIGGLRPFDWLVSVAWTEGSANYAFDVVPAEGFASYP